MKTASKPYTLQGHNRFHTSTVVCHDVELNVPGARNTRVGGTGFATSFCARFEGLRRLLPGSDMNRSFLAQLEQAEGVPLAEVLLQAVVAVETAARFWMHDLQVVDFAQVHLARDRDAALLVWASQVPKLSQRIVPVAIAGVAEALASQDASSASDFSEQLAALRKRCKRRERSTTTSVLALAARQKGIPCESIGGPFLRLGHGRAQQTIYSSFTANTGFAATRLARNKRLTNRSLGRVGLPVARQVRAKSPTAALRAAEAIGYPVVVKPLRGKQAGGVMVGIRNAHQLTAALESAQLAESKFLVEKHHAGHAHRLLVVGGRFIAALKFTAPRVSGDGRRTIGELVAELNRDPMRDGVRQFPVNFDAELDWDLAAQGFSRSTVLERSKSVPVRLAENVAIGGTHTDVTAEVHPDNQRMAELAAQTIGLDVAGIDYVTRDIGQSYRRVGGCILEVNARPGLCMHVLPRYGNSQNVGAAVLDLFFDPEDDYPQRQGRIPTAVVLGQRGTTSIAGRLAGALRETGHSVGLATKKGVQINGHEVTADPKRTRAASRRLLRDPSVEVGVFSISPARVYRRGLHLDRCTVVVLSDAQAPDDLETMQDAIRVAGSAAEQLIVVSEQNEQALPALAQVNRERIVIACRDRDSLVAARHLTLGGSIVHLERSGTHHSIVLRNRRGVLGSYPLAAGEPPTGHRDLLLAASCFGMQVPAHVITAAVNRKPGRSARADPLAKRITRSRRG